MKVGKLFPGTSIVSLMALTSLASLALGEAHMDLTVLENVKTLDQADQLYHEWKLKQDAAPGGSAEEEDGEDGMEEDRYRGWRTGVINHINEKGEIDWTTAPTVPPYTPMPPAVSSTPNWTQLGPFTFDNVKNTGYNPGIGRLQTIEIDPNDDNTIYVGAPIGGIWKTTNGGSSWTNLMKEVPNHGVGGIAVNPSNSNIIIAAGGEDDGMGGPYGTGIFRSTNAGQTWTKVKSYYAIGRNAAFHPTNHQKVIVGTGSGAYISNDAGASWSSISGTSGMHDIAWDKSDDNYVYVSFSSSVKRINLSTGSSSSISGLPSSSQIRIETSSNAPNKLFILCALNDKLAGFYVWDKSQNRIVKTYNQASGGKNILGYSESGDWNSEGFTWYALGFAVSDENANLISAGSPLVWRSDDGGTEFTHGNYRWSQWKAVDYNHPDIHDLGYRGNKHYVISDGGIRVSSNGGASYTDISHGISAVASYQWAQSPVDGSYQVTGLQDLGNFVRRGSSWYTTAGGDGYGGFVDVSDKTIMYFTQGGTRRSTSGDFMQGYETVYQNKKINYMSQSTNNPNNMIGAGDGGLYYSTNRGKNWTTASGVSSTGKSICYSPINENKAWAVAGGRLYKSTNAGRSWTSGGSISGNVNDVACDSQNENVAWVVVSGTASKKVLKTTNGGSTWNDLTSSVISGQAVREITHDGKNKGGIYIGTSTSVFYYDDEVGGWVNWSDGLPWTQIQEMSVHIPDQKLRMATWGRGIWESDLYAQGGGTSSATQSSAAQSSAALSSAQSSAVIVSSAASSAVVLSSAQSSAVVLSSAGQVTNCTGVKAWVADDAKTPAGQFVVYQDHLWYAKNEAGPWETPQVGWFWEDRGACQVIASSAVEQSSFAPVSSAIEQSSVVEQSSITIASSAVEQSSVVSASSVTTASSNTILSSILEQSSIVEQSSDVNSSSNIATSSEVVQSSTTSIRDLEGNLRLMANYAARSLLIQEMNPEKETHIMVLSLNGKVLFEKMVQDSKYLIGLDQFGSGRFFLSVRNGTQVMKRVFVAN